jgi:hypothetical protein
MEGIEDLAEKVHVDGLVVLKIMNHCHQGLPTMVAGSLLVDEETGQEVGDAGDAVGYQMEMMKMLREVGRSFAARCRRARSARPHPLSMCCRST